MLSFVASAPVCSDAALTPASVLPDFKITMGLLLTKSFALLKNSLPFLNASR
jgi:hypothetical protein